MDSSRNRPIKGRPQSSGEIRRGAGRATRRIGEKDVRELRRLVYRGRRFRDSRCLYRPIDGCGQLHEFVELADRTRIVGMLFLFFARRDRGAGSTVCGVRSNMRSILVHQVQMVLVHQCMQTSSQAARGQIGDQRHLHNDFAETSLHGPLCSSTKIKAVVP